MIQCWTLYLLLATMLEDIVLAASVSHVQTHGQNFSSDTYQSPASFSNIEFSEELPDDVMLGCKELRAKRFISDGFCTSLKPIKEVVCAGHCMPIKEQNLPWWAEYTKYWAKPKRLEFRCVEAVTKRRKVQLMCQNGETRTYKIKVVKSCKCKQYTHETNLTKDPKQKSEYIGRKKKENKKKKREKNRHRPDKNERRRLRRLRKLTRSPKANRRNSDKKVRGGRDRSRRHKTRVITTNKSPLLNTKA